MDMSFFEVIIAIIIAYIFIKFEKPKIRFLFLGYLFFLVSVLIQTPIRIFQSHLINSSFLNVSPLVFLFLTTIISEFTKYFSLKRFLKTKSYKNGILFGIGWVSLESINLITIFIFSKLFSIFNLPFNHSYFLGEQYSFLSFPFFFLVNLAISVFVIIGIIKKNIFYVFLAILFSIFVSFSLIFIKGTPLILIIIIILLYSIYIIFKYKKYK